MYFDMAGGGTYSQRGVREVLENSSGHDKLRFTVVLTISADGGRLRPMIIFKNLKNIPKLQAGEKWPEGKII